MIEKLKSRKLVVAVVGVFAILATQLFGVPEAAASAMAGDIVTIVSTYVLGQGAVDAAGAFKK